MEGLAVAGLTKRYGDRVAVDDLTFEVPAGSLFGLLGPNGAGKSTTIRSLLGLVRPDAGAIRWRGSEPTRADRRRWGYMPEGRGLYPRMKVRDHLVHLARLHGMAAADARQASDDLLEILDLTDRAGDRVEQLSHGNQQRVQLAVSIVHHPDLLVLDEPFSGLDPVAVDTLAAILRERAASGTTVLFSSHQLEVVQDLCEQVVIVDHGRLVLEGEVQALRRASPGRVLRVDTGSTDASWSEAVTGTRVLGIGARGISLALDPSTDPLDVLDAARAVGPVVDFELAMPNLAELFREAVR
jgi:ABC-2 type transport system ATP-binding protein